ncbi:MAG0480 family ComEC-like protein [Mycoplasma sp. CSL7475-4]|uniref:MAG0480 family ComEC-like protein n=1 Tax=Mycoplasma sp. CSL7475-4 TaxID=2973942 RepID=UPI0037C86932
MDKIRTIKRNWTRNIKKIKKNFNSLIFLMFFPIVLHLSAIPIETQYFWIFFSIIYTLFFGFLWPKQTWIALILILCYIFLYLLRKPNVYISGIEYNIKGRIAKTSNKYAIINVNNNNLLIYLNKYTTPNRVYVGDIVEIDAFIEKTDSKNYFALSNNIQYFIKKGYIKTIKNPDYSIDAFIENYSASGGDYFKKYWKLILFGINNDSQDVIANAIKINIIHLLVISGLHFEILFKISNKLIAKIRNKWVSNSIKYFCLILIFYYLTIINNPVPALRAFIMHVFLMLFPKKNWSALVFSALIIFAIDFNNIISITFLLSYSITLVILITNKIFTKWKINKVLRYILFIIILYLYMVVWTIKMNNFINITGIIYSLVLAPIIEIVYILSIFFSFSPLFLNLIYLILDKIIIMAAKFSIVIATSLNISQKTLLIWMISYAFFLHIPLFFRPKRHK